MRRKDQLRTQGIEIRRSEERNNVSGKFGMQACIEFIDEYDPFLVSEH